MQRGLAAVVIAGSAFIYGCAPGVDPLHEVFRYDEEKNMAPLAESIEIDFSKYDSKHRYVIREDRAYLKDAVKPQPIIEEIVEVSPYTRYKIPALGDTIFIKDANDIMLQYNSRKAAPDLLKLIQANGGDWLKNIKITTNQNTLIFRGKKEAFDYSNPEKKFKKLTTLLNELDKPAKQIRAELTIVEFFYDNTYNRDLALSVLRKGVHVVGLSLPSSPDPLAELVSGIDYNPWYNYSSKKYDIGGAVDFLNSHGKTRTLAKTELYVSNGTQAEFKNLLNYPYLELLESKTGFVRTVKYRDTGTTIKMTPFANEEGFITVKVDVMSGEHIGFAGPEQNPVFREADFKSEFIVRNAVPYLIGTSISARYKKVDRGIPLIDKLPIVNELFSSKSIENFQSQLLYFMILRDIGRESSVGMMRAPEIGAAEIKNSELIFNEERSSEPSLLLK